MKNNEVKQSELKESKEVALHYMKILVDTARESFLILDADLRVILANPTFYKNFRVTPTQTENVLLYKLGNGQWNIPQLKNLLEEILPDKKVVKNYEVGHTFQTIGEKTIVLNARQIDTSQLIILALEDISVRKELEEKLVVTAKGLAIIAKEKEDVRRKLVVTAKKLAVVAKEKENVRSKLAVTAKELVKTASGREDVRKKLAVTAKEKEDVRKKLAVTAGKLSLYTTRLEEKVMERTKQLDASNQQLNASNQQLRATNQQLAAEGKVLKEKISELEVFSKATVGRELKMIKLKKEIEELKKK